MTAAFRHEALFYEGLDGFVDGLLPFVRAGVAAGEPTLVAVDREKIEALTGALGDDAGAVDFADMRAIGRNPGCIIPVWREFVAEHAGDGRRARGVGEPIWAGRSAAELDECHRHEALLHVAFDDGPPWKLVCPYDAGALPAEVVDEARRTHPYVGTGSVTGSSGDYLGGGYETLAGELAPPPARRDEMRFTQADLAALRTLVLSWGRAAGLGHDAAADLVLAVNELATNSVRHGGGEGVVRAWREPDALVCEVRDSGRLEDPLAGRSAPHADPAGGRGLWLVHQLCDLVQVRSLDSGCTVRLYVSAATPAVAAA